MKFINYLESIAGVSIYPLTSLLIFVVFFALLILFTIRVDKEQIAELKNLPIEEQELQK